MSTRDEGAAARHENAAQPQHPIDTQTVTLRTAASRCLCRPSARCPWCMRLIASGAA